MEQCSVSGRFLVREVVFREGCVMMGFDLLDISPPFFLSGMRFSRWEWAFRFIPEWRFWFPMFGM